MAFKSTVAISKETYEISPAIVMCQEHIWNNGFYDKVEDSKVNISDKDWVYNQFFRLNDKMNISISTYLHSKRLEFNLIVGNNTLVYLINV